MAPEENAVYCTLLLSDHYLPGAVVLAHSLRDNGATSKLVVLYTPDNLQPATINELKTIYDELIPVDPTTNGTPANLWLMDRPDLISAFTKIELWRQTQFSRIVYIDCDVVALRAPDELLSLDADFAAAPDVGWPDCFNSGVMVLRPNLKDYYALGGLAEMGVSFDGADQGLLNEHFRDLHRLSFTYNCTPSANYQYIPAYRHFQNSISLIHFIGAEKPWNSARPADPVDSPYNQLLGKWWAVYDRHYRPVDVSVQEPSSRPAIPSNDFFSQEPEVVAGPIHELRPTQDYLPDTSGEQEPWEQQPEHWPDPHHEHHHTHSTYQPCQLYQPKYRAEHQQEYPPESQLKARPVHHTSETMVTDTVPEPAYHIAEPTPSPTALSTEQVGMGSHEHTEDMQAPALSAVPQYVRGEEHVSAYIQPSYQMPHVQDAEQHPEPDTIVHQDGLDAFHIHPEYPAEPTHTPRDSRKPASPEPDVETFEPPKAEWDASREPPPLNTKPEAIGLQRQTYTMSDDPHLFQPPSSYPEAPKDMYYQIPETKPEPKKLTQLFPWESRAPKPTRVFPDDGQCLVSAHGKYSMPFREEPAPSTGSYGAQAEEPAGTWENYPRSNAWDEIPEIQNYVQAIQQSRKARFQVVSGTHAGPKKDPSAQALSDNDTSVKLTDFPSEVERPSLPVTPRPIRRPSAWDRDGDRGAQSTAAPSELPAAEGVPNQEDWNPLARLEELRRRQSEVLDNPDLLSAFHRVGG